MVIYPQCFISGDLSEYTSRSQLIHAAREGLEAEQLISDQKPEKFEAVLADIASRLGINGDRPSFHRMISEEIQPD